jgi:hypothetical protein
VPSKKKMMMMMKMMKMKKMMMLMTMMKKKMMMMMTATIIMMMVMMMTRMKKKKYKHFKKLQYTPNPNTLRILPYRTIISTHNHFYIHVFVRHAKSLMSHRIGIEPAT